MKLNVYLIYPSHVYYEFIINNQEQISNVISYFHRVYPETTHNYETKGIGNGNESELKFINIDTNKQIDTSRTYEDYGFNDECNIKINLKIVKKTS
jgi:hypothetical protein